MEQKLLKSVIFWVGFSLLGMGGCSKDKEEVNETDLNTARQVTLDEQFVVDESDRILDESSTFVMQQFNKASNITEFAPCNVNLDSIRIVNDTTVLYLTYNGLSCNGRINRTGHAEVRIKKGAFWVQPGTTLKIKLINYTATRVATGKSVTLNGEKTLVNVTGGHIGLLGITYDTIIHEVSGHMQAAFDNGTTRQWNIARRKIFTGTQGQLQLFHEGFGTSGDYTNLVTWGIDRHGNEFYTQVIEPVVFKQTCDWNPVSGIKKHFIPSKNLTITTTFGFDTNNQPITSGDCPTKLKLEIERNGKIRTVYLLLH